MPCRKGFSKKVLMYLWGCPEGALARSRAQLSTGRSQRSPHSPSVLATNQERAAGPCWDHFIFCKAFRDSVGGKVLRRCELVRRSLSLFTCCVCLPLSSVSCQPIYPRSPLTLRVPNTSSPNLPAPRPSLFPTGRPGLCVMGA